MPLYRKYISAVTPLPDYILRVDFVSGSRLLLDMKPYLDKAPKVLEIVRAAYRACGMEPQEEPIRGGTDGARLSVRGLPCPNVFTGGMNFHGVYECIPVKSLDKGAEVAVMLAKKSAEVTSLQ